MITLTKYEQSAFLLVEHKTKQSFAFDFGSFSDVQRWKLPALKAVFVSHEHGDHYKLANVKRMNPKKIFGSREVYQDLINHGLTAEMLTNNDRIGLGVLEVSAFEVDHGPISKPISNLGFHVCIGAKNILFLGDMKRPGNVPDVVYDVTMMPIGDGKVFSKEEAFAFLKTLRHPGQVIPIHYHGNANPQSGLLFKEYAGAEFQVDVLDVNQSITLL